MVSNAYQAVTKKCDWLQDAACLDVIKQINSMTNPKIESLTKGDKTYNDPANGAKGTLFTVDYYGQASLEFRKHNSKLSSRYASKVLKKEALLQSPLIWHLSMITAATRKWFMAGYNEMLRRIEPEKIVCYNTPFPEMRGDIVYVDYERSSWKYMSYERNYRAEDLDAFKIGETYRPERDTIEPYLIGGAYKGGGSAYGGKWRPNPNKPQDQRFLGKPGEIKTTYKNGYRVDTKIGEDGRAVTERHYTDHKQPWAHTNPHDHPIHWNNPAGYPDPQPAINYPNGAPEFKQWRGACNMIKYIVSPDNPSEQNRFVSISDFKTCMKWHGEVEFMWNENLYSITPRSNGRISISMAYCEDTEKLCDTSDEVLEYMVGSDRLRDVITQVTVLDRSI